MSKIIKDRKITPIISSHGLIMCNPNAIDAIEITCKEYGHKEYFIHHDTDYYDNDEQDW